MPSSYLSPLWAFSRPHTIKGTALSITSISLAAISSYQWATPAFLSALVVALFTSLLMNVYIVGINQIFDVAIDVINKPYLPLASGEFTRGTAWLIVLVSCAMSLICGVILPGTSSYLMATLVSSFILGAIFSKTRRSLTKLTSCRSVHHHHHLTPACI